MSAVRPKSGACLRVLALCTLWAVPSQAVASDAPAERPATWDMTVEQLREIGLGQYRGDPRPVPAEAPHETSPNAPKHAKQGRIFVNFDGETLGDGWDDSTSNVTQISELVGSFAAYGDGDKRDAVMQAVRADWEPFDVIVTDTRPATGDYTMNMTGPTNPFGGGVLGIAPVDCGDEQTHNNITYAFHSANDSFSAAITATTIGQEVAHSYGLEHVDEPGDIMNPFNAGGDASFIDQCIPIVQNLYCPDQHVAECGSQSQQNSFAELMTLFGPSTPDAAGPTVSITSPSDGDTFPTGSSFTIVVAADDDQGIEAVTLYSNDEPQGDDTSAPFGWDVNEIPAGYYELYVVATDTAGNETASSVVSIEVGDSLPPPSGDGGGDGASDGGDDGPLDGGDDGSISSDRGSLPDGFGQGLDGLQDGGCTCQSGTPAGPGAWLSLLGLAFGGAIRRRR